MNSCLQDRVILLSANLDDISAESIGYAMETLLSEGALDVYCENILMKKNRPGIKFCVLSREEDADRLIGEVFKHTTAIGIRKEKIERCILAREIRAVETSYGKVRVKFSRGYGVQKHKVEYDDLSELAQKHGLPIEEMRRKIEEEIKAQHRI